MLPGDPSAPSQVTPNEAIGIAQQLASHPWQPFGRNVLHGKDRRGVIVHTPDISHEPVSPRRGWWVAGMTNHGIPYKWGGYDSPQDFDAAIARGHAAGDVSSPAKRRADNAAVSAQAAGLDCSGFVSKCLKLPFAHDTRALPAVCEPIADPTRLQPGDLLNIPRGHVILCAGWAKPDRTWIYFYDTGSSPDYWKPGLKMAELSKLLALGYQPLRYKGMARPVTGDVILAAPLMTRSIRSHASVVDEPEVGEP